MIYENKIDWSKGSGGVLSFTQSQFKSAVLDYQIQVEGEPEDIIKRHFRNPEAYDTERMQMWQRVAMVRSLIGKTPDDRIWDVIESLAGLRNKYAHSRFTETEAGKKKIKAITDKILVQLKSVWPDIACNSIPDQIDIIRQAHLMVQRFFREINEALDRKGLPQATPV